MFGKAHVYRFGDSVAAYIVSDINGTAYLNPKEARKLAKHLIAAAKSCENETFTESKIKTLEINIGAVEVAKPKRDKKPSAMVLSTALNYLKGLIESGQEFPDACDRAAAKYKVSYEALKNAYDEV